MTSASTGSSSTTGSSCSQGDPALSLADHIHGLRNFDFEPVGFGAEHPVLAVAEVADLESECRARRQQSAGDVAVRPGYIEQRAARVAHHDNEVILVVVVNVNSRE